jgi:hypothetical protein
MKEMNYDEIAKRTVCTECGGSDMGITFIFDGSGALKKKGTLLGMDAYTPVGNILNITCRGCGLIAKSFAVAR